MILSVFFLIARINQVLHECESVKKELYLKKIEHVLCTFSKLSTFFFFFLNKINTIKQIVWEKIKNGI